MLRAETTADQADQVSTSRAAPQGAIILEPHEIEALRARIRADGDAAIVRTTGVGRTALMRACAGLPVRRGTAALVRIGLMASAACSSASERGAV